MLSKTSHQRMDGWMDGWQPGRKTKVPIRCPRKDDDGGIEQGSVKVAGLNEGSFHGWLEGGLATPMGIYEPFNRRGI